MPYVFIPMQYYSDSFSVSMIGELPGFECRRLLSQDLKETTNITGYVHYNYDTVNTNYPQALLYTGSGNISHLGSSDTIAYSGRTLLNSYGVDKHLQIYNTSSLKNQRMTGTGILTSLMYGSLITLPEIGRLKSERSTSFKYEGSEIIVNLKGTIDYDGIMNNGYRRDSSLSFEFLKESEKNLLVDIFTRMKGTLPFWYLDDTADDNSWMLVSSPLMKIQEPASGYFSVDMTLKEF